MDVPFSDPLIKMAAVGFALMMGAVVSVVALLFVISRESPLLDEDSWYHERLRG